MATPTEDYYSATTGQTVAGGQSVERTTSAGGSFVWEVDVSALQAGDLVILRILGKLQTADGSYVERYREKRYGVQDDEHKIVVFIPITSDIPVRFTVEQLYGTKRNLPNKVIKI